MNFYCNYFIVTNLKTMSGSSWMKISRARKCEDVRQVYCRTQLEETTGAALAEPVEIH